MKLGIGESARDIFLTARSMTIRHRIRQIKFTGAIITYIGDLSEIVFRLIRNTSDWYGLSFREAYMASGFIKWTQFEIEHFASLFRRQVFETKIDFASISACLQCTMVSYSLSLIGKLQSIAASGTRCVFCVGQTFFSRFGQCN